MRVCDDILRSLDEPHGEVILVLLDLSAAFDTIDHALLLQRLHQRYGIEGKVLQWFESYLHQREQSVLINSSTSDPLTMEWGIPQGSIGGPILFVSYTAPVEDIIHAHGLSCIIYADDTQLYISMKSAERSVATNKIEQCICDIKAWMTKNYLVLNDSKTEVLHFTSRYAKTSSISHITAGEAVVNLVPKARDLGVILDTHMTMRPHINSITRSASFALKKISSIRKYLDRQSCEKLVHAFISSRLDNCNSLLINLPDKDLRKLQRIQNSSARLIALTRKRNHITPVLFRLHWLPVYYRIIFKVLLLTYKTLSGMAPAYMSDIVRPYVPVRTLRSSHSNLLQMPGARTVTYGERAFSIRAPKLWNALPMNIKQARSVYHFKKLLKQHLFKLAYDW